MFQKDKDITSLTTFGIPAKAALYAEYSSLKELERIAKSPEFRDNEVLNIGEGSNLLFVSDFAGLVLRSRIDGIVRYDKDPETVFVIAGAGVKWTDFVDWCVCNGLAGVENLAGIPGTVGASAVQNVGAYGVEAKDVIHHVECFDTLSHRTVVFHNNQLNGHRPSGGNEEDDPLDCGFAYRDSKFKHEWKGRYIVVRVSFSLRPSDLAANLSYGPLKGLAESLGHSPTIAEVAAEVVKIRNAKLPDPKVIGSAGSFFKNPIVNSYYFKEQMLGKNPDIPFYPVTLPDGTVDRHRVKVPAGWLIEHAGLKGFRIGGAEVYPKQCLVIANAGGASASDVVKLSDHVIRRVREDFNIVLKPEVNFIDTDIEVTILGSGTSKGIPEVSCACPVCRSASPFDKRLRASALLKTHGMNIMIDVSPDFRQQALREDIVSLDAAIITHSHYDHVGGIDDLRPFCAEGSFPLYLRHDVEDDLRRRLDYCFREHLYPGVPSFELHQVEKEPFFINGLKIIPISVMHGRLPILGYRIGDFAYITDAKTIDEEELDKLQGLKVLVVNALRYREHFSHFSVSEALRLIERLKPEEAYLTHFCHDVSHAKIESELPPHVHSCYDGLKIKIKGI